MNLYVETNFVLELALLQEQVDSCMQLVELAQEGRLNLHLPAVCLFEADQTLTWRLKSRKKLQSALTQELGQLNRNADYATRLESLRSVAAFLAESEDEDKKRRDDVRTRLLTAARLLPLESRTLELAFSLEQQHELSPPDSLVLASILLDLRQRAPGSSCFLTRDRKDFGDPALVEELGQLGCKVFHRFDLGLRYVLHHAQPSDPA